MAVVGNSASVFAFTVPSLASVASLSGSNTYDVMIVSSPEIKSGTSYTLYKNATVTGSTFNGLYTSPTFSAGTQSATFTTNSTVTTIGSVSNNGSQEGSHANGGPGSN